MATGRTTLRLPAPLIDGGHIDIDRVAGTGEWIVTMMSARMHVIAYASSHTPPRIEPPDDDEDLASLWLVRCAIALRPEDIATAAAFIATHARTGAAA